MSLPVTDTRQKYYFGTTEELNLLFGGRDSGQERCASSNFDWGAKNIGYYIFYYCLGGANGMYLSLALVIED